MSTQAQILGILKDCIGVDGQVDPEVQAWVAEVLSKLKVAGPWGENLMFNHYRPSVSGRGAWAVTAPKNSFALEDGWNAYVLDVPTDHNTRRTLGVFPSMAMAWEACDAELTRMGVALVAP